MESNYYKFKTISIYSKFSEAYLPNAKYFNCFFVFYLIFRTYLLLHYGLENEIVVTYTEEKTSLHKY